MEKPASLRYIDARPQRPRLCVEVLRNGPTRNAGSRMSPARNRQAPCFHLIILIKKNIYGRLLADPAYFVCRRPFPAELHKAHPRQWMRGTETSAGRPMGRPGYRGKILYEKDREKRRADKRPNNGPAGDRGTAGIGQRGYVSGSGPIRPCPSGSSRSSKAATCSEVSRKSKTSLFSLIRSRWTDLGMGKRPFSRCQRSSI